MLCAFLSRLLRDERGTSVIEMSFIIPVLVMLGCAATDLAMCYARQLSLQQAAARTMEYAIAAGFGNLTSTQITNEGTTAAGAGNNVAVTPDMWLECDGVRQASTVTSCTGSTPARFASITITDTYNWMFEQVVPAWNRQPYGVNLRGYAVVRIQ